MSTEVYTPIVEQVCLYPGSNQLCSCEHSKEAGTGVAMSSMNVYKEAVINRLSPTPLYKQIEDSIRTRINSGQWPKYHKLKAEAELAEEFGVSRGTLRQALQGLVEAGLLTQVQGRGTFVASPSGDLPLAQRLVTMHEVLSASGQDYVTEVLAKEVVRGPEKVRTLLDLANDEGLLYLRRRMVAHEEPIVALENYVRTAFCPGLAEVDYRHTPLFEAIENLCGLKIGWGQRSFAATTAGAMADVLGVSEDKEPVLYLEQISYLEDGAPIEFSEVWVRGEKLRVTTILSRNVVGESSKGSS
jgi:DNA-binding GntR family transcriptional regulator